MSYSALFDGLQKFNLENQKFKYTQANWDNIEKFNRLIIEFNQNPEVFVDTGGPYTAIQREVRIASLRSQISQYITLLDWEQTKYSRLQEEIRDKKKTLEDLKAKRKFYQSQSEEKDLEQEIKRLEGILEYYEIERKVLTHLEEYQKYFEPQLRNGALIQEKSSAYYIPEEKKHIYQAVWDSIALKTQPTPPTSYIITAEDKAVYANVNGLQLGQLQTETQLLREIDKTVKRKRGESDFDFVNRVETETQASYGTKIGDLQKKFPKKTLHAPAESDEEYLIRLEQELTSIKEYALSSQRVREGEWMNVTKEKEKTQSSAGGEVELKNFKDERGGNLVEFSSSSDLKYPKKDFVSDEIVLSEADIQRYQEAYNEYFPQIQEIRQLQKTQSLVGTYSQLPKQKILSDLHAQIPRNTGEDEKTYIQRIEKFLELKSKASPTPEEVQVLKKSISPNSGESDDVYMSRIRAMKPDSISGLIKDYKALPENNKLSLESQAILNQLKTKFKPAVPNISNQECIDGVQELSKALKEYQAAKSAESPAVSQISIERSAKLYNMRKLVKLESITDSSGSRFETEEEYLKRVSGIIELYDKFERSKNPGLEPERLYSRPERPIQSITYEFEGNSSQTIPFTVEFRKENQRAINDMLYDNPVVARAVIINYTRDGETYSIKKSRDGQFQAMRYPNPSLTESSEDALIDNICESLAKAQHTPLLTISNLKAYGSGDQEGQKIRFIKKLAESYCIDERGRVDTEKQRQLKNALLKGTKTKTPELSYDEFFRPEFDFLREPSALLANRITPEKSFANTESFRHQIKNLRDSGPSLKEEKKKRSWHGITTYKQDEQEALAAWRDLRNSGQSIGDLMKDKKYQEQIKLLMKYHKIGDDTQFEKKFNETMLEMPVAAPRHKGLK